MRKIIIAGSATFYKEALDIKKELEKSNYDVIDYPKKINDDIEFEYKEVYESFYENLSKLMIYYYLILIRKVLKVILVMNLLQN